MRVPSLFDTPFHWDERPGSPPSKCRVVLHRTPPPTAPRRKPSPTPMLGTDPSQCSQDSLWVITLSPQQIPQAAQRVLPLLFLRMCSSGLLHRQRRPSSTGMARFPFAKHREDHWLRSISTAMDTPVHPLLVICKLSIEHSFRTSALLS